MENSATESAVFVRVKLNRRNYVAGELVEGKVFLRLKRRVQSSDFVVHLEGREHVSWQEHSAAVGSPKSVPRRRHNKDVLKEKIKILEATAIYQPGDYDFPFKFSLPDSLPSSFQIEERQLVEMASIQSSIAYKVRATIRLDGELNPFIEDSHSFIVRRPLPTSPMRPIERSTLEKVRVFRVFSRGTCTLSASLDHDEIPAGDAVTVFTSIRNQSSKDMTGMSVRLVEDLAVDVPFRTQKRGSTVLCRRDFPGVRARRQAERALTLNLVTETPWSLEPINPTMTCNFIQCKYRLIIMCTFRLCSSVKVEFPVTVSCQKKTARISMARMSGPFSSPVGVEDVPLGPKSMPRMSRASSSANSGFLERSALSYAH